MKPSCLFPSPLPCTSPSKRIYRNPFVASNGLLALATIWPGMAGTPAAAFLLAKTAVANASCQNPTLVLADAKVSVAHCCTIFLGHLVLKYMIKSVRMLVSRLVSLPRLYLYIRHAAPFLVRFTELLWQNCPKKEIPSCSCFCWNHLLEGWNQLLATKTCDLRFLEIQMIYRLLCCIHELLCLGSFGQKRTHKRNWFKDNRDKFVIYRLLGSIHCKFCVWMCRFSFQSVWAARMCCFFYNNLYSCNT